MTGTLLLQLECVTPAHLGATGGEAMLDRPTQKDVLSGLPFLPGSALKGVLAGAFGDIPDDPDSYAAGTPGASREARFGSPDRGQTRGVASSIVVGNADLLAFPLSTGGADGAGIAWVFPVATAAKLARFADGGAGESSDVLALLARLERDAPHGVVFSEPAATGLAAVFGLRSLDPGAVGAAGAALGGRLRFWAGFDAASSPRVIVAGTGVARHLWPLAAERRTLTALEAERRIVRDGSLRTVELIPAGSVFVAPVTLLAGHEPDLEPIQAGAWESLGLGWLRLSAVEKAAGEARGAAPAEGRSAPGGSPIAPPPPGPAGAGPDTAGGPARVRTALVMKAAHAAVASLAASPDSGLRTAARAAVYNFGPRARLYGLGAAVAFSLARAKPGSARPKAETRAHRWLLGALVGLGDNLHEAPATCPPLNDWLAELPFQRDALAAASGAIVEQRWRWLRRYAEVDLAPPPAAPPPSPEVSP